MYYAIKLHQKKGGLGPGKSIFERVANAPSDQEATMKFIDYSKHNIIAHYQPTKSEETHPDIFEVIIIIEKDNYEEACDVALTGHPHAYIDFVCEIEPITKEALEAAHMVYTPISENLLTTES